MARGTIPITITLSPALYEQMNSEAESMGLTRSAFVTLCLNQYFKSTEALHAVDKLQEAMAKLQELQDQAQLNIFNQEEKI